jgi:hypothetical protein
MHDNNDRNTDCKAPKRGKVSEYSLDTHRRYNAALDAFIKSKCDERYDLFITLTTTHRDPKTAKRDLQHWVVGMRYYFECHGVYVMEFNDWDFVHYHIWIRFTGRSQATPTTAIAVTAKYLWALRGHDHPKSFEYSSAWGPDGLKHYLGKSDHQDVEVPVKARQKRLPAWLKERGTGCNWWGYIGRKRTQARGDVLPFGNVETAA